MALFTVVIIVAIITASLIIEEIPAKYGRWDLSTNQILTLGDITKGILSKLDKDVAIHIIASPDSVDKRIRPFVSLCTDQSPHIRVVKDDLILRPDVLITLDAQPDQILVACEEVGKKTAVSFSDTIQINLMAYYQYQQIKKTAFDGEEQIIGVVSYMTDDNEAAVYILTGHQEPALSATIEDTPEESDMILSDLSLMTDSMTPQDRGLLTIDNPQMDINQNETATLTDHLKNGGYLPLLPGATQNRLTNLSGLCSQHGMDIKNGFMVDSAPRHPYNNSPFYIISEYDFFSGLSSGVDSKQAALATQPPGMTIQGDLRDGLTITPLLTTSDPGTLVDLATQEKTESTYALAATTAEAINEEENTTSVFTVIATPESIPDDILTNFPNITNLITFMNTASHKVSGVTILSIPSKSLDITYNMITPGGLQSTLLIIVIPVVFLITGSVVQMKYRKLQGGPAYEEKDKRLCTDCRHPDPALRRPWPDHLAAEEKR